MKHKSYKNIITFVAICFLGSAFAQKFDKKITENFKTNKDVEVEINATNTEINVTSWNKNEVQVQAFIEIEGLSKIEAEKYFKNWDFEALGNSRKVEITSKGSYGIGAKTDFIFFNDMDFSFPDINIPDIDVIVLPEMNFDFMSDFDFDFEDLDDLEDSIGKNGRYDFRWNDGKDKIVIKTKKEWEAFKKTKKYKELKKKMAESKEKLRKEFKESKAKMKKQFAKAKVEFAKVDKIKIKEKLAKAQAKLKEIKFNFHSNDSGKLIIDGKEIKIKKRLEIKVPKNATFDLNTRHCKVKLPNTVASGNVKYGSFNANNLIGGKLTIDYSKVNINNLNTCSLFLNNVTDAKIASVTNAFLSNNSSGVNILRINEKAKVKDKFGKLIIESFHPNFTEFILDLSYSDATITLGKVASRFKYEVNRVKLDNKRTALFSKNKTSNNLVKVLGEYSSIIIK
ncbi:hypothetical protein [Polaribacter aquimarinus]|uniref:Adhesin domain-containing protein n=1 Tax=Polaribacter aquimarinus TaxID=2100726 RepID=A0A2U2J979_9FLAO|nr:hypothetical protein [Polaribacter aquimarinus]PWG04898.1 hypothetical protein DIS07_10530 [Polaribacter aquimarinus]